MTIGRRWKWCALVAVVAIALGACGADDTTDDLGLAEVTSGTDIAVTDTIAAGDTVPGDPSRVVPADPAAMCFELFRAWSAGELTSTSRFVSAGATAELAGRSFAPAAYGLAGQGDDCFITQYDTAAGSLLAVGDVVFEPDAGGATIVSAIVWADAIALPASLTDRLMRSVPLVYPGGVVATTVPGTAPTSPGDTTASSPAPGAPSSPEGTTPGAANPTVTPTTVALPTPRATTPTTTAPPPPVAPDPSTTTSTTTTTLAPTIGQASDTALAEDCANSYQPACAELERRYPPGPGDGPVANEFVNAVIAGDTDSAAAVATPGLIGYLSALSRGPYPAIDGIEIPGSTFGTDGRLQFRVTATTIVRCYVAAGLVRHCSSAAG